jgi:hypothetical protein
MATIVDSDIAPEDPSGGTTTDITLTGIQAGDAIEVVGVCEGNETISFADDRSNTYVLVGDTLHGDGFPRCRMMRALNCAAGDTVITMTLSGAQYRLFMAVAVRPAGGTTFAHDVASTTSSGTSGAPATTAMVATANGIAIAGFGTAGATTIGPDVGWTQLVEEETGNFSTGALAYKATTAGSHTASWTSSGGSQWVAWGDVLKEVASAKPYYAFAQQ